MDQSFFADSWTWTCWWAHFQQFLTLRETKHTPPSFLARPRWSGGIQGGDHWGEGGGGETWHIYIYIYIYMALYGKKWDILFPTLSCGVFVFGAVSAVPPPPPPPPAFLHLPLTHSPLTHLTLTHLPLTHCVLEVSVLEVSVLELSVLEVSVLEVECVRGNTSNTLPHTLTSNTLTYL